jgi:hypothetical protein
MILQPPLDGLMNDSENQQKIHDHCTIYDALGEICESHPRLHEQLFRGNSLSPFIHIFLNGDFISSERYKDVHLVEDDELCLLTAIRGG